MLRRSYPFPRGLKQPADKLPCCDSFVVISSLVFHFSFVQCYPTLGSSYLVGKSVKYRFVEFFVFDFNSLTHLLSLFFLSGVNFSSVALD